jgi:hypothetical protein
MGLGRRRADGMRSSDTESAVGLTVLREKTGAYRDIATHRGAKQSVPMALIVTVGTAQRGLLSGGRSTIRSTRPGHPSFPPVPS